jgi:hypothetical protein
MSSSGFSFYANDRSLPTDEQLKKQANREWSDLRSSRSREEVQVFQGLRAVLSSGAGMGRILQHLENTDIAFVSAFLTGKNPGARGYGVYEEGETDSMGKAHKAGEMVSRNENKRKNKSLASAIEMAGYGFLKVKGKYEGVEEETFCVINAVEDSEQFAEVMHRLGNSFEQDSVLVCPKGKTPYFFRFDGSKKYADSSGVSPVADAVEDYFTQIKGKKFKFQFSNFSFLELGESDVWTRSSLSPIRGSMVAVSADAYRRKLLSSGLRSHTKSRRGVKSELNFWDFDQWLGANNVYSSLGRGSLLNWMVFQGYSEDAYNEVLASLNRTLAGRVPGSQPITSSAGPRSLAAWSLDEKAQKLKAGGLTYKETGNLLAKEAGVLPKEVKDIIGTSSEWWDGVFDYGLEPLHQDEEAAIQSQRDRAFEKETEQIYSAVVAKQDPIKEQFLSGQINLMGAIDELVASGMDYDEAEEVANSWLP